MKVIISDKNVCAGCGEKNGQRSVLGDCNGILRAISISPLDPCVPYYYDADKNKISVDTYICEKCGNIVGRKRLDK